MKKTHLIPSIILLSSIILTLLPFFKPGLFYVHDPTSAFRLYTLIDTIKSGQFPAAWNNSLNYGFGYPLHLYYAPLFGYLGAVIFPLIRSYEIAVKLALFIASIIGTFGVYKIILKFGRYPALLAAVAFTFLPYRASALYVRGSYSEFLAMSLIPWVLYYWSLPQTKTRTILSTAVVTALFVLSHNTLPLLVIPTTIVMIGLFQTKNLMGSLAALGLSAGLTTWFIFPVLFERSFVQVEMVARLTSYKDHFLSLSQLWYSPWGYGGSAKGIAEDHMSFMIGKGQLLLALIGAFALIYKRNWKWLFFYCAIIITFAFLSLNYSLFVWERLSFLSIMQFPWRTLAVIGVGVSVLSGLGVLFLPAIWQLPAVIVATVMLVVTNFSYFRPQEYRNYNNDILSSTSNLDPLVKDKIPEYLPAWMPAFPLVRDDDGFEHGATAVRGAVIFLEPTPLTINTAYMPQWRLLVDGSVQKLRPTDYGTIITTNFLEAGSHTFDLVWKRTPVEKIGIAITAITILVMIGLLVL